MLWDAESASPLVTAEGHEQARFSPNGRWLTSYSRGGDTTISIWNAETGRLGRKLSGRAGEIWFSRFSNDSRGLVTVSREGVVKIWDVETGSPVATFFAGVEIDDMDCADATVALGTTAGRVVVLRLEDNVPARQSDS